MVMHMLGGIMVPPAHVELPMVFDARVEIEILIAGLALVINAQNQKQFVTPYCQDMVPGVRKRAG